MRFFWSNSSRGEDGKRNSGGRSSLRKKYYKNLYKSDFRHFLSVLKSHNGTRNDSGRRHKTSDSNPLPLIVSKNTVTENLTVKVFKSHYTVDLPDESSNNYLLSLYKGDQRVAITNQVMSHANWTRLVNTDMTNEAFLDRALEHIRIVAPNKVFVNSTLLKQCHHFLRTEKFKLLTDQQQQTEGRFTDGDDVYSFYYYRAHLDSGNCLPIPKDLQMSFMADTDASIEMKFNNSPPLSSSSRFGSDLAHKDMYVTIKCNLVAHFSRRQNQAFTDAISAETEDLVKAVNATTLLMPPPPQPPPPSAAVTASRIDTCMPAV